MQFEGSDIASNRKVANTVLAELHTIPGLVDLRIQQPDDYPVLTVNVDRTKASQGGYSVRDVGGSLLNILSGSTQLTPQFFLNLQERRELQHGGAVAAVRYQSLNDLQNIPISSATARQPEILADVATITRSTEMPVVTHYNIRRTLDIYGNVQDTDLGAVNKQINKILDKHRNELPRGSFVRVRGQIETMQSSYFGLIAGLAFSIVLVYLLIVVNFQSWLDPFIIITALPAALAGIILFLFITRTTLSVPALMGAIMCMGVATANSILVVSFAKERLDPPRRRCPRGSRGRCHPLPPRRHDRAGDDHRHDPDGDGRRRRRRAERSAGPRGDRRPDLRHRRYIDLCAGGLQPAAQRQTIRSPRPVHAGGSVTVL